MLGGRSSIHYAQLGPETQYCTSGCNTSIGRERSFRKYNRPEGLDCAAVTKSKRKGRTDWGRGKRCDVHEKNGVDKIWDDNVAFVRRIQRAMRFQTWWDGPWMRVWKWDFMLKGWQNLGTQPFFFKFQIRRRGWLFRYSLHLKTCRQKYDCVN